MERAGPSTSGRLSVSQYELRRNKRIDYSETKKAHNFQRDPAKNTILIRFDYLPKVGNGCNRASK